MTKTTKKVATTVNATADVDGVKWQFDHLNRPLKNVLPGRETDANTAVMYFAMTYELERLDKEITKKQFVTVDGVQIERELSDAESLELADLKDEKTRIFKLKDSVDFAAITADFTSKDFQIVKLVAWGNVHAIDKDNNGIITFGKPKTKHDKTSVDTLTGYTALLSALELYKATILDGCGKNVKKAVTDNAIDALQAFMDYVYNVDNERNGEVYHSSIFCDGIQFNVNEKFFRYIESLTSFKLVERWNDKSEKAFSGDFWKSITTYLYHLYTYGNDSGFKYTAPAFTAAMLAARADDDKEVEKAAKAAKRKQAKAENKSENKTAVSGITAITEKQ